MEGAHAQVLFCVVKSKQTMCSFHVVCFYLKTVPIVLQCTRLNHLKPLSKLLNLLVFKMFMFGPAPVRRTLNYLKDGFFIAKDSIRVMEVHYHLHGRRYQSREEMERDYFHGLRQFYFWEMPRIQYKNPHLQIVRILDKMPTPFIRFWSDDGNDIIIDCFSQSHQDILDRVVKVAGKTKERLKIEETIRKEVIGEDNPALFGHGRERFCACEVPGQHPCPGVIRNPRFDQLEVDIGGGKSPTDLTTKPGLFKCNI